MKFLTKKGKVKTPGEDPDVEGDDATKKPASPPEQAPQVIEEPIELYKFGIADRLEDAVNSRSPSGEKRSPDLVPLTKEFDVIRKRLRQLNLSVKQYHDALCKMNKQRSQVAKDICVFAEGTVIEKPVCNTANKSSFVSIYEKASSAVESDSYENKILDYVSEWEAVVTRRVDKESAEVEKLRKSYIHYQNKVDSMRKKVNANETNGKETNEATAEKLKRNEEKLDDASKEFEDAARPLCILIEEVVRQGWKDVLPLIKSIMKWETARCKKEASIFSDWHASHIEDAAPGLS